LTWLNSSPICKKKKIRFLIWYIKYFLGYRDATHCYHKIHMTKKTFWTVIPSTKIWERKLFWKKIRIFRFSWFRISFIYLGTKVKKNILSLNNRKGQKIVVDVLLKFYEGTFFSIWDVKQMKLKYFGGTHKQVRFCNIFCHNWPILL
jgi:hypothetical protein